MFSNKTIFHWKFFLGDGISLAEAVFDRFKSKMQGHLVALLRIFMRKVGPWIGFKFKHPLLVLAGIPARQSGSGRLRDGIGTRAI